MYHQHDVTIIKKHLLAENILTHRWERVTHLTWKNTDTLKSTQKACRQTTDMREEIWMFKTQYSLGLCVQWMGKDYLNFPH